MLRFVVRAFAILAAVLPLGRGASCNAAGGSVAIPNPSVDAPLAPTKGQQTAVLAGGCFLGHTSRVRTPQGRDPCDLRIFWRFSGHCVSTKRSAQDAPDMRKQSRSPTIRPKSRMAGF